jgi:hypothetical protein
VKEMGAAVSQANKTNNPDITGTPQFECISHVPSLLAQENSCRHCYCLLGEVKVTVLIYVYRNRVLRTELAL